MKEHRQRFLAKRIKDCRNKTLLQNELDQLLNEYSRCALVSGEHDYHEHTQYLHCEAFIHVKNQEIYRSVVELGFEECKQLLIDWELPRILEGIVETIENKTL